MIRKTIISALLGVSIVTSSIANTVTTTIAPAGYVNLLPGFNQSILVSQVIITATTATNVSALIIDTPTNVLTYINPAYTNTISYATNYNTVWTNYYGVTQTNYAAYTALIDLTNNLVASTTNNYPQRLSVATLASTSAKFDQVNYYFNNGIWATNTGSGNESITITYR